mmetsp:Transcript_1321/g.1493  ORF Transcript_1321/g.1493 Transcript_1321/m.1493 type:complete len:183 (+) Transcript_1321:48-596(+)
MSEPTFSLATPLDVGGEESESDDDDFDFAPISASQDAAVVEGEAEESDDEGEDEGEEDKRGTEDDDIILSPMQTPFDTKVDEQPLERQPVGQLRDSLDFSADTATFTPLERRVRQLNESLRRNMAKKVQFIYTNVNKELVQASVSLNRSLGVTQDTWENVLSFNNNIQQLSKTLTEFDVVIV